jgi:hypothetical protein
MYNSLTELIKKIPLGEDATIEFKRELPRRRNLADEITALANARGGTIPGLFSFINFHFIMLTASLGFEA